jgi:enoyl-[acyl-carrier protein] reductase II
MGTLGANAGQTTVTTDPVETGERLRAQIRKTRALTDRPFAVNCMMPTGVQGGAAEFADEFSKVTVKVACEEGVQHVVAVGDMDQRVIEHLKQFGLTVIYRAVDPTIESSRQAEAAGADIVVATGFDEGGGMPSRAIGTFGIVPMIADAVSVPVMAAGAIADNRGMRAALALGAEGVFVGTAFIVAEECVASAVCKQDIIDIESDDLVTFKALPAYWRATPHALAIQCRDEYERGASPLDVAKLMMGTRSIKTAQLDGDLDAGISSVGTGVSLIKEVRTCKAIIEEMVGGLRF